MAPSAPTPTPTGRRGGLPMVLLSVGLVVTPACGGAPEGWTPRGGRVGVAAVYEATARYIVQHYVPDPARDEAFGVVCLTMGRRHTVPIRQQERDVEWDPPGGLLGRLEGLPHPVAPVSECRWNQRLEEVHLPTDRRAVVVALSYPLWETEQAAWVDVRSRESQRWAFRYRCHLVWRTDQWSVRSCL